VFRDLGSKIRGNVNFDDPPNTASTIVVLITAILLFCLEIVEISKVGECNSCTAVSYSLYVVNSILFSVVVLPMSCTLMKDFATIKQLPVARTIVKHLMMFVIALLMGVLVWLVCILMISSLHSMLSFLLKDDESNTTVTTEEYGSYATLPYAIPFLAFVDCPTIAVNAFQEKNTTAILEFLIICFYLIVNLVEDALVIVNPKYYESLSSDGIGIAIVPHESI